jgi:hypothetical protein
MGTLYPERIEDEQPRFQPGDGSGVATGGRRCTEGGRRRAETPARWWAWRSDLNELSRAVSDLLRVRRFAITPTAARQAGVGGVGGAGKTEGQPHASPAELATDTLLTR